MPPGAFEITKDWQALSPEQKQFASEKYVNKSFGVHQKRKYLNFFMIKDNLDSHNQRYLNTLKETLNGFSSKIEIKQKIVENTKKNVVWPETNSVGLKGPYDTAKYQSL